MPKKVERHSRSAPFACRQFNNLDSLLREPPQDIEAIAWCKGRQKVRDGLGRSPGSTQELDWPFRDSFLLDVNVNTGLWLRDVFPLKYQRNRFLRTSCLVRERECLVVSSSRRSPSRPPRGNCSRPGGRTGQASDATKPRSGVSPTTSTARETTCCRCWLRWTDVTRCLQ